MSVKFKEETITTKLTDAGTTTLAAGAQESLKGGKHDLAHEVGEAITKGGGVNGYLAVCCSRCFVMTSRVANPCP
jgi:hypothetical protein